MSERIYYIYKITNNITGKEYIGMRTSNSTDDGYYGSGLIVKRSVQKYGKYNHTKEILEFFDNREEMAERERELVNEEYVARTDTMNLHIGGVGGGWTREQQKENNLKSQIAQAKLRNDNNWVKRKSEKISTKNKIAHAEGRMPKPKPHIPGEFKHTEEAKQKIAETHKGKNGNKREGRRWISNPNTLKIKLVTKNDIDSFLSKGWVKGKITKATRQKCDSCGNYFKSVNNRTICSRKCAADLKKKQNDNNQQEKINIVRNSNIDFSKRGWMAEVGRLIDKNVMVVKRWMIRNLPDIYETAYKRK